MKGLLLKDLYMMKKHCRFYLIIAVLFIALSVSEESNLFFVFYPCLLCSMVPVNLLGYDERSRWPQYCETMPYSKAQIVSGKYLIGLMLQVSMLTVTGIVQAIRMSVNGAFSLREYGTMMMLLIIMAAIASSLCLPFMFKLGLEKGRIAYYVTIGLVCACAALSARLPLHEIQANIGLTTAVAIACLVSIGLYALSWYLSIVFYKKREL